jgi:hypothetical protein
MALTIEDIKKKKIELESAILKLVQGFENETDTFVSYMDFSRKISKDKAKCERLHTCTPEPERDGPIENVNVNMRFDL